MKPIKTKVSIIGAGMVGSAIAKEMLDMDLIAEIALIDLNEKKSWGEGMDLSHATSFPFTANVNVHGGTYDDCIDSQFIIITAGPSAKPGDSTSRLDLGKINIKVIDAIMKEIVTRTKDAIIIVVTNPVDIITYYIQKYFDYPKQRIFGTGTVLDTARFLRVLGSEYLVDTQNVNGFILGEHGMTAFAAWSQTNIAGVPIEKLDDLIGKPVGEFDKQSIMDQVIKVGYELIMSKGYTNFGIAAAVRRIVQAILLNELTILPVSTTFNGEYGIEDISMSIPCIIGSNGVERTIQIPLTDEEIDKYNESATFLKNAAKELDV